MASVEKEQQQQNSEQGDPAKEQTTKRTRSTGTKKSSTRTRAKAADAATAPDETPAAPKKTRTTTRKTTATKKPATAETTATPSTRKSEDGDTPAKPKQRARKTATTKKTSEPKGAAVSQVPAAPIPQPPTPTQPSADVRTERASHGPASSGTPDKNARTPAPQEARRSGAQEQQRQEKARETRQQPAPKTTSPQQQRGGQQHNKSQRGGRPQRGGQQRNRQQYPPNERDDRMYWDGPMPPPDGDMPYYPPQQYDNRRDNRMPPQRDMGQPPQQGRHPNAPDYWQPMPPDPRDNRPPQGFPPDGWYDDARFGNRPQDYNYPPEGVPYPPARDNQRGESRQGRSNRKSGQRGRGTPSRTPAPEQQRPSDMTLRTERAPSAGDDRRQPSDKPRDDRRQPSDKPRDDRRQPSDKPRDDNRREQRNAPQQQRRQDDNRRPGNRTPAQEAPRAPQNKNIDGGQQPGRNDNRTSRHERGRGGAAPTPKQHDESALAHPELEQPDEMPVQLAEDTSTAPAQERRGNRRGGRGRNRRGGKNRGKTSDEQQENSRVVPEAAQEQDAPPTGDNAQQRDKMPHDRSEQQDKDNKNRPDRKGKQHDKKQVRQQPKQDSRPAKPLPSDSVPTLTEIPAPMPRLMREKRTKPIELRSSLEQQPELREFYRSLEKALTYNVAVRDEEKIVCAVSGGVDSTVLLDALCELSHERGYSIVVAHFNHKLRGDAAERDEQFVRSLAEKRNLPFFCGEGDVADYANRNRLSIEVAAREMRYRYFEYVLRQTGATTLALAHTANDVAETVLMNLVRGSGLTGLCGMPERRSFGRKTFIVRPLLRFKKEQLLRYAQLRELSWHEDETNALFHFTRNKVRHELLPLLEQSYSPAISDTLIRTARLLQGADELVGQVVSNAMQQVVEETSSGKILLSAPALASHPAFLQGELVQRTIQDNFGLAAISLDTTERILQLLLAEPGTRHTINRQLCAVRERESIAIVLRTPANDIDMKVEKGNTYTLGDRVFSIREVSRQEVKFTEDPTVEFIDAELLPYRLTMRTWQQGDKFQPIGMQGTVKISDFLTNQKVPVLEKSSSLVLCSAQDIIWVCGLRINEKYKVTRHTTKAVRLEYAKRTK